MKNNTNIVRVDDECYKALNDIQAEYEKKRKITISKTEASRILGRNYFTLKNGGHPKVVWDWP